MKFTSVYSYIMLFSMMIGHVVLAETPPIKSDRVPCFASTVFSTPMTSSPDQENLKWQGHKVILYRYENYHVLYGCKPGPQPCSVIIDNKKEKIENTIRVGAYISPLYNLVKYFRVEDKNGKELCEIKATLALDKDYQCALDYQVLKNPENCRCETEKASGPAGDPAKLDLDLSGSCLIAVNVDKKSNHSGH